MIDKPEYFKHFEIYLGYACNRACRFCFVEKKDKARYKTIIPFRKICGQLLSAYQSGFRSVSFLGGEPTVYADLPKLILTARKIGYTSIVIFSNGLKLSDKKYIKLLYDSGLNGINLNLPACEEESFNYLTNSSDGFKKAISAVKNIVELKIPLIAVCVLNKYNYKKLPEYASFYNKLGIKVFVLQYTKFQGSINASDESASQNIQDIAVPMSDCSKGIKDMTGYCLLQNIYPPFVEILPPCILEDYASRVIDFNQTADDYNKDNVMHPDNSVKVTFDVSYTGRLKIPVCEQCVYKNKCYGIEKNYISVFGDKEFKPVVNFPEMYYSKLDAAKQKLATTSLPQAMYNIYEENN